MGTSGSLPTLPDARCLQCSPTLLGPTEDLRVSGSLPRALPTRPLHGGDSAVSRPPRSPLGACCLLPPGSPGGWGRGAGGGLWDAFQADREAALATLCSRSAQSPGLSPERGAGQPMGQTLALEPRFPHPRKPAPVSPETPRSSGFGSPYLRPDLLPRPCTAWLGRRRAAGLSHTPPILGTPKSLCGGLGLSCRSGHHPSG